MGKAHEQAVKRNLDDTNILTSVQFHSYFKILKPFKPKCLYVSGR